MSVAERLVAGVTGSSDRPGTSPSTLDDPDSEAAAVAWWEQLVDLGGEGMVVNPHRSIVTGKRGLIQAGIKCRGPEYLPMIYGPG